MSILLKAGPAGDTIADLTGRLRGGKFRTGPRGFETFTGFYPCMLAEAYRLYDRPGTPHLQITWGGGTVWEGRLEDLRIDSDAGGASLGAFGYWRALRRRRYTGLWSTTMLEPWRPVTAADTAKRNPTLYNIDKNNRLYLALKKNAVYIHNDDVGAQVYIAPSGGERDLTYLSYNYSYNLPAGWYFRLAAYDSVWGSQLTANFTTTGGTSSGSSTWGPFSARDRVTLEIFNNSGSNYTNTSEDGIYFAQISSVRITSSSANIFADEIARGMVSYVNALNPAQLSADTGLIESPAVDLRDELYEDDYPAEILDRLAQLGDGSGNLWEAGVWEDRRLHFRPRGSAGRTWYTDAASLTVDRSVAKLVNSQYALYQEAGGRKLRTAVNTDADSVERWGETVEDVIRVQTTSSTQAQTHRDTRLADRKTPIPRAGLRIGRIYDSAGVQYPKFLVRSSDVIVARNIPPTLSVDVDRIRSFRIAETEYALDTDDLLVTPESSLPALDVMIARQAAGIR